MDDDDRQFLKHAIAEARTGWDEGGVPIGAALVHRGELLATGRNRRVQLGSAIRHGETDCLENAGRRPARVYRESVLYTTLSPATCAPARRCSTASPASWSARTAASRHPRTGCAPTASPSTWWTTTSAAG
ncbi:nucleoside deaminase [Nocardioides zeae]